MLAFFKPFEEIILAILRDEMLGKRIEEFDLHLRLRSLVGFVLFLHDSSFRLAPTQIKVGANIKQLMTTGSPPIESEELRNWSAQCHQETELQRYTRHAPRHRAVMQSC